MLHFWGVCRVLQSKADWESTNENLDSRESVQCINYFGVSGQTNPATVAPALTYPLFVNTC